MPRNILETLSRALADSVDKATDDEKRALCLPAAQLAISHTNLDDPTVFRAIHILKTTGFTDKSVTAALQKLVEEFELRYFDAEERYRAGKGDKSTYIALARKARAADAVLCAFDDDTFQAATCSLYEAYSAGAEVDELETMVRGTLNQMRLN